ncbi:unnamed protein product, partial [marine sediment metagenome]
MSCFKNLVEHGLVLGTMHKVKSRIGILPRGVDRHQANLRMPAKRDFGRTLAWLCFSLQATTVLAQQQAPTTIYSEDFQNDQAAHIAAIIKV